VEASSWGQGHDDGDDDDDGGDDDDDGGGMCMGYVMFGKFAILVH
jgi:hypothetical protein